MKLQRVEAIPFESFKEKITLTKKYDRKAKIRIEGNLVIIEYFKNEVEEAWY